MTALICLRLCSLAPRTDIRMARHLGLGIWFTENSLPLPMKAILRIGMVNFFDLTVTKLKDNMSVLLDHRIVGRH